MRIGIDVGGTNTDAALLDGRRVLAEVKVPTTRDVTGGIREALGVLLERSGVESGSVQAVMIGTTHFTNAVVEAKRLVPVAAVRLGLPATKALPPMVDWPQRLRDALGGHVYLCHGGHEFDGRSLSPLNPEELRRVAADAAGKGLRSFAISSVFSPVNGDLERAAAAIVEEEVPGTHVSLSHELGRIGLIERENATVMNACLRELAVEIVAAFRSSLEASNISAPLYLSQNDGTLMDVEYAERYPVATFASGPTNSMRGAAFLSGLRDCAVVDIGGTTSDVGLLVRGFPRKASMAVEIGGVRTNFRMPDVLSLGIGGGSLVDVGAATVGPQSVGYEIRSRALVFGGETLTATDLAVAAGRAEVGEASLVSRVDGALARRVLRWIEQSVADTIDRMKTSREGMPVVVVGGGSILLGDELAGASELVRPDHYAVANAIGAAIAQIGGEVDRIVSLEKTSREEAFEEAKREAAEKAVAAGAAPDTVEIVDVEEVPLAYLPGNASRIRVKAVGDFALGEEPVAVFR